MLSFNSVMGGSWLATTTQKKKEVPYLVGCGEVWQSEDGVSVTGTDQSLCEGKLMKQAMVY